MTAYVICLNDFPEHVVLDDEAIAKVVMEQLAKKAYDRELGSWKNFQEYRDARYWHIKPVEAE